jgi:hypothetical protein
MKIYEWVKQKPEFQYYWTKEKGWVQKEIEEVWKTIEIGESND